MKIITMIVLFLFLSITLISQGWEWLNPYPNGNHFNDIQFIGIKGWIVGNSGSLLITYNSGNDWYDLSLDTNLNLKGVSFVDTLLGWIAGESAIVYKTTDGGLNWSLLNTNETVNYNDLIFTDSLNGWVVGEAGRVVYTSDGGNTWTRQSTGNFELETVCFIDDQIGWAAGWNGCIRYTSDGGDNWNYQTSHTNEYINSIFFINANEGWYCTDNGIVGKSSSGGGSWSNEVIVSTNHLYDMSFTSSDSGWIVGGRYQRVIIQTIDGGENWIVQANYCPQPKGVFFHDNLTGWIVGTGGSIYKTVDAASNWTEFYINTMDYWCQIFNLFFIDDQTGWAAAYAIYKTVDGGVTWNMSFNPSDDAYYDIYFTDSLHGCAVGEPGFPDKGFRAVQVTTDGGNSWTVTKDGPTYYSVFFIDYNHGWIAGDWDIAKSTDGGFTWVTQLTGFSSYLYDIFFIDSLNGWTVGGNNMILYTEDGGSNWITQFIGGPNIFNSVFFSNNNNGWIVGDEGVLLQTSDGGGSWIYVSSGTSLDLNEVKFVGQKGWIVGEGGIVLYTQDNGDNWLEQLSRTRQNINCVEFINSTEGWIGGEYTSILHTNTGGGFVEEEITLNENDRFSFCYPNPFSNNTNIYFNLNESSYVTIDIYNCIGQKINSLYNGYITSLSNHLLWNGKDYDGNSLSGIYLYKIEIKNNNNIITERGRLILIN